VSRPLRAGIVGYGLAGRSFHSLLLKGAGFEIASICTKNPERIAQAHVDFPEATVVVSIEELLTCDLDLVVIASTNIVHAEQAIASIKAGITVVVDKPMAVNVKETELIIQHSIDYGVGASVFFNRKWDSDALTVKKVIDEGILGNIFRLESRFERFRPDVNSQSWREQTASELGGGNLLDLQPHLISTAVDWFGPASLEFSSVRSVRKVSDDDVLLILKHENGIDSYLSASAISGAPGPRIRLMGDKGALVIRDLDPQENLLRAGKHPIRDTWNEETRSTSFIHQGDTHFEYASEPGNYAIFYAQIREAISSGAPPESSLWPTSHTEALVVAQIIDEARKVSIR
jgi:scyllo-inositol 2-dehydrogenase (NADP+)